MSDLQSAGREPRSETCGFITVRQHFDRSAEIHCIAVLPTWHRRGVGRAMIEFTENHLRGRGVEFLQVKPSVRRSPIRTTN